MSRCARSRLTVAILSFLLAALAASPGLSQDHDMMDGDWPAYSFEVFGGHQVSSGWISDDVVYGLRTGYNFRTLGLQLAYERIDSHLRPSNLPQPVPGEIDADLELYDLSLVGYLMLGGDYKLLVYGGPGVSDLDVEGWPFSPAADPSGSSFTLHAGVGFRQYLGQRTYFRPDLTVRWIKDKDDFRVSGTVAIGFGTKQVRPSTKGNPSCRELRWEWKEVRPQIAHLRESIGSVTAAQMEALCQKAYMCYGELTILDRACEKCRGRGTFPADEIKLAAQDLREDLAKLKCDQRLESPAEDEPETEGR